MVNILYYLTHIVCCFSFLLPTELHKKKELPGKEKLLDPRSDPAVFAVFCNSFLSCLVGKVAYKGHVSTDRIADFVSVSNEAYALVYLENSFECWEAEAEGSGELPSKKWTSDPQAATLYKGWSKDGILRYNEQSASVKGKRKESDSKKFEGNFREQMKEGSLQKEKKKPLKEVVESVEPTWESSSDDEESSGDEDDSD
jgi:hypothetical protein